MKEGAGTIGGPTPKGWLRALLRVPILLYRMHIGWLLGHRFLLLTHVGRKSRTRHHTVLEVICYASTTRTCIVASGWGEKAQWLKNIMANPDIEVTLGAYTHRARARRMSPKEAEQVLRAYARRHPWAIKQLARFMPGRPYYGRDEDFTMLAEQVPLVELEFVGVAPRVSWLCHPQSAGHRASRRRQWGRPTTCASEGYLGNATMHAPTPPLASAGILPVLVVDIPFWRAADSN